MRYAILAAILVSAAALADEGTCPPKPDDPCLRWQKELCDVDVNPPPWSTPESLEKKREKARKNVAACRKNPPPPPKEPQRLPPWRKP